MSSRSAQQASLTLRTSRHGDTVRLEVGGDLLAPAAGRMRAALVEAATERPRHIVVDLTAAEAVDNAGLGALLIARLWAGKVGAQLSLIPSQCIRNRLTDADLSRYFTLNGPDSV